MNLHFHRVAVALAALFLFSAKAGAATPGQPPSHPFLLWTRADAAKMRKAIETQPWAKQAYEELLAAGPKEPGDEMRNLFRYLVMGDRAAGDVEKKNLLSLLKAPEPLGGALEFRLLAYDVLYDELTPQERGDLEARFRKYIAYSITPGGAYDDNLYNNSKDPPYSRYDAKDGKYGKTNWLPNIIFPRKISANLAAVVLGDEKLIRETWAVTGSIQWYLDEYLSDWGFYQEEFSKMLSTPGALYLYMMGLRHLGLDELGLGYKGKNGATFKGHIHTAIDLTFGREDLGSTRPAYQRFTAGDLNGYPPFQNHTVEGYFMDGTGGNELFRPAGAWGGTTRGKSDQWDNDKTEKMAIRLWFEFGQALWPGDGFDYFLAQMRAPKDERFIPTLYFGLSPIDPKSVSPPPAPSWVAKDRGVAMLRAVETPAYWESGAPTVAFRLPSPYAHSVNDPLVIAGFFALGRPLYQNPHINNSYAFGFSRSIRSHAGVMVDGHLPPSRKEEEWGKTGSLEPQLTNDFAEHHHFAGAAKFVSARSDKIYPKPEGAPGIDQTRALVLTDDYLVDVYDNVAPEDHTYTWMVHAVGRELTEGEQGQGWKPSQDLAALVKELTEERSRDGSKTWSVTVRQGRAVGNPDPTPPFPPAWFDRAVGVRMTMLGQEAARGYLARTPRHDPSPAQKGEPPPGPATSLMDGTTILAKRTGKTARFIALHEPWETKPPATQCKVLVNDPDVVALEITGLPGGATDLVLIQLGDSAGTPKTVEAGDGRYTFTGFAHVRTGPKSVVVSGTLGSASIPLPGGTTKPALVIDGKEVVAKVEGGRLTFGP